MSDAASVFDGLMRPGAFELLTRAARALHGPGERDAKLAWVVDAAEQLTGAAAVAFVGVRPLEAPPVVAIGALPADVDRLLRPVLSRLLDSLARGAAEAWLAEAAAAAPEPGLEPKAAWLGLPVPLPEAGLLGERPVRLFLQRLGLPVPSRLLCLPVPAADGASHGALICCWPDPGGVADGVAGLLAALALHTGVALDNAVTMDRLAGLEAMQREAVHQLQEAVRPPMPSVDGVELGVHYLPADPSSPTGGDLYDWMVMPQGDLHLAVVDIMGKGVAATKDAVSVMHALRLLALDGCPIHRMVARADELVTAHNPDLVATVVVARYQPSSGVVHLAGGGQPPPLVVSADGRVRTISIPGVAIGWPSAGTSEVVTFTLDRNDTLVMYTDGLIEATKDVLAGIEMLCAAAAETVRYPADHLARSLVERSLAGAVRRDDSLALVLRRRVPPSPENARRLPPLSYRFSPNPATISLGRHLLADWLDHLSVEQGDRDDLILGASELCSNAVRHASGTAGALELRARAEGDSVIVEVVDDGGGFDAADLAGPGEPPDLGAEHGRGLFVVRALVDDFEVRREGQRTVVRITRRAVLPAG